MAVTILLTAVAMMAFAANSLLARAGLAEGAIDAVSFTAIRLISGGLVLLALLVVRRGRGLLREMPGSWPSAMALFAYALAFSLAYLRLGAASGALILFASVQGGMMLWGLLRRDRPTPVELGGLAIAFSAFVYLLLPGLDTPDPVGSGLMIGAGLAWAVYTLRGQGGRGQAGHGQGARGQGARVSSPLEETAGNFARAAALCIPLAVVMARGGGYRTEPGVVLAMLSGVVTSGLGYAVWYLALPRLSTIQAAVVQLTVPVLAALGGVALLAELPTPRLLVATACILGGVGVALVSRRR